MDGDDTRFTEVADRVWVARHSFLDVNTSVVAGTRGLLVVDTLWSAQAGRGVLAACRSLPVTGSRGVVAAVNTHHHFDHVLGNAAFAGVEILAHEIAVGSIAAHVGEVRSRIEPSDPHANEVLTSAVSLPSRPIASAAALDLGDRLVELVHLGRGHTAGDLVVRVADADVVLAGDLVEESGPPGFGADCFPLEWPATLDLLISLLGLGSVVVPGHGAPVDRSFVEAQREKVGVVAETARTAARRGLAVNEALTEESWPYPAQDLEDGVRRAYAQLPRDARTLPLL